MPVQIPIFPYSDATRCASLQSHVLEEIQPCQKAQKSSDSSRRSQWAHFGLGKCKPPPRYHKVGASRRVRSSRINCESGISGPRLRFREHLRSASNHGKVRVPAPGGELCSRTIHSISIGDYLFSLVDCDCTMMIKHGTTRHSGLVSERLLMGAIRTSISTNPNLRPEFACF